MFKLFSVLAVSFLVSISAHASRQELVSLSCVGTNGLRIEVESGSEVVTTKLGFATKTFETNRTVMISDDGAGLTRIALGLVGASHVYVYDIFLERAPTPGQVETLSGVIGRTLYGVAVTVAGPVPLPFGFRPSTNLSCDVLTQ